MTVLVALLHAPLPTAAAAPPRQASEYDLKAAFLYNFTRFVEWPPDSFAAPDSPLRICVLGPDPFGDTLDEVVRGERADGRELAVQRLRHGAEAADCQLLFLSHQQDPSVLATVPAVRQGRVLTVGESDEFLRAGGLLRFDLRGGRIRLQVNAAALDRTRLRVSSKLLRLADRVRPRKS